MPEQWLICSINSAFFSLFMSFSGKFKIGLLVRDLPKSVFSLKTVAVRVYRGSKFGKEEGWCS